MLSERLRRAIWIFCRKTEGRLRTLLMIATHTMMWPPTIRRLATEVYAIRNAGFDPEFYTFNHMDGELLSPFWHYVLIGRYCGQVIKPHSAELRSRAFAIPNMSQQHGPAFSVMMPTLNRINVLGRAIESVLGQSEQDFELLIIDDGSIDGTSEWVRNRYNDDLSCGRMRLIVGSGTGVSPARNLGLKLARGRWVAYLDSDNFWLPHHLASHKAAMQAGARVVFSSAVGSGKLSLNYDRALHLQRTVVDMNGLTHERALVEIFGGFDTRLSRYEDYDLTLRLCRSLTPTILEEATFVYLIQHDSLSIRTPMEPSRSRLHANHALERVLVGLESRDILVSSEVSAGPFGKVLLGLQALSRSDSPELIFAAPGEPLSLSSDAVVYVIGEAEELMAPHVAAYVADRGPLSAPRIAPEELIEFVSTAIVRGPA